MAHKDKRRASPLQNDPSQQDASDTNEDRSRKRTPLSGAVRESPTSSDETDSSTRADATNPRAREERSVRSSSGIPADDPDSGDERKKLYEKGATLVSRID